MALVARDIWTTLIRLGLLDPAAATGLAQRAAGQLAAEHAAEDPVAVAKYLIAQRVLTKFQAKRLLAQRAGELRQGEYLILDRIEQPPLSRWLRAQHLPSGTDTLVYPCSASAESKSAVDPAWLRSHAAVAADGLQPLELVQLSGASGKDDSSWRGLVSSPLPAGQTLSQWLAGTGPLDRQSVVSLGQVLAGALSAMHAASLFHGGVRPGRIWIGDDAVVYLLRCGGGPPICPGEAIPPRYDWFDDDGQAADFASPQWLQGGCHADAQSDVYALGAVLYRALRGKRVQPGELPADIAQAVAAGASGDPLLRTLAAALAADPAARFADASAFLRALEAVGGIVADHTAAHADTPAGAEPAQTAAAEHAPPQAGDRRLAAAPAAVAAAAAAPTAEITPAPAPVSAPAAAPASGSAAAATPAAAPTSDREPAADVAGAAGDRSTSAAEIAPSITPVASPAAAAAPLRRRKRTRRSRRGPIIIGSSAAAVLLLLIGMLLRPTPTDPVQRPRPSVRPPAGQPATATATPAGNAAAPPRDALAVAPGGAVADATDGFQRIDDDRLLWVPPWSADVVPGPLNLVTPGAQAILSLRLGEMLRPDAAVDWLSWFGPELDPALQSLQQRTGLAPQQIDRLVIGLLAGSDGQPEASLAVWLAQPVELQSLRQQWGVTASRTPQGHTLLTGQEPGGDAYYVPGGSISETTLVSAFAVGTVEHMRLVAEGGGGPIPLPRAMQMAWDQSSESADLVALVSPNFLFADGRKLLQRFAPRAIDPLRDLLVPDVSAAVLSLATDAAWYGELRLVPGGSTSAAGLVQVLQEQVAALPAKGESFLIHSDIDPSWRALAIRLPQYLRAINDQTRFGISQSLPTANFYLPSEAAPQVALASLLALSTQPAAGGASVAAPQPTALSIDQLLDTKLSIRFDQESLQFAVSMISEEFAGSLPKGVVGPEITIVGSDLEKLGITQNQQIRDFQMRDVPLRDVLTHLVLGANPDKTATGPADPKQSLVWVVDPASTPAAPSLLITTRPQAEAKGLPLPREFTAG